LSRKPKPAPDHDTSPRARIVDEAERLFLDYGYSRFTMDQLALELGMSKKTLYKHYESKDDLLAAALDVRAARIDAEFQTLIGDDSVDFATTLVKFVEVATARFAEVSEPFLHDVRRSAPALFRKIETFREQAIVRHVESFLAKGGAAGVFREDLPYDVVASMLMHAAQNMLLPKHGRSKMLRPPGTLVELVVKIVCEGIIVRPQKTRAPR
jgi:AcrR family transcriptional regulator